MNTLLRHAVTGALSCAALFAQSSLPDLGLLFDRAGKSLRPVWGIPGSAFYGAPLDTGIAISATAIAPAQDLALAATADGVFIVRFKNGAPETRQLDGAAPNPDLLVLSPSGGFGALYYADRKVIALIGPLTSDTPAMREISSAAFGASAYSVALSDDGQLAAALTTDGGDSPQTNLLILKLDGGDANRILTTPHGSAVAFIPGTSDVVFSDDADGSVSLVRDVAGTAERRTLLSGEPRLAAPSDVLVTADGKHVLGVSAANGGLGMLDLDGGDPSFLSCRCEPSLLRRLGGKLLFQVTPLKDGIAWIVEWDPANPRLLFVPPEVGLFDQSWNITGDN